MSARIEGLEKALRLAPFKDVVFSWEHRRPIRDEHGNIVDPGPILAAGIHALDLVPNAGLSWISSQMAGTTSGKSAVCAVGTGTATPTMGDVTLVGEITGSGLTRTTGSTSGVGALAGLPSGGMTTQGTGSFYVWYTWTASGTVTVNEAGVSPDISYNAGIIARDILSPAASMAAGDTLKCEWNFVL
ncbi:MAG: hypothetical protein QW587_04550 [Candidatus Bathyarchaeia archaeon]